MSRLPLLDRISKQLLNDFGAGGHEPGSGSAAALDGLLAANLTNTVIDLTERYVSRSPRYFSHIEEQKKNRSLIKTKILPQLENLFENDSLQFDRVIKSRKDRLGEKNSKIKLEKDLIVNAELRKATEIPIQIAKYCHRLGEMATYAFDYGFISARGDSATAIHTAAAGMLSCLSIIELNLQQLPADEWMEMIRKEKDKLETKYHQLDRICKEKHNQLKQESDEHYRFEKRMAEYKAGNHAEKIKSDEDLEKFVTNLQQFIWIKKEKLFKKDSDKLSLPMQVLKPQEILISLMKYAVIQKESLGTHYEHSGAFEVAGLINKKNRVVEVSQQFPVETMRFTLAHELGHALLHHDMILHRDKPIDGSHTSKNPTERQADKFAAYFLMPRKQVIKIFRERFGNDVFTINQETVFRLDAGSIQAFREKCQNLRGLGRELARVNRIIGFKCTPISAIFGVSDETMAIRLEELGLIKF